MKKKVDFTGCWTGEFSGTNQGGVFFDIINENAKISGTAKIAEPKMGQYECNVTGEVENNQISLYLVPTKVYGHFYIKNIIIKGIYENEKIQGRWQSPETGTEGLFTAERKGYDQLKRNLPKENSIFIVHGHDEAIKNAVARYLERIGVKPIILHEKENRGMTIIEKFETFAERAGFAIIIMTPDDYGYKIGCEELKQLRPRQNVLIELGYFYARLGREKTVVLKSGNIEVPSDIFGIVYEEVNSDDGWKMKLARELRAAGFLIDLNKDLE